MRTLMLIALVTACTTDDEPGFETPASIEGPPTAHPPEVASISFARDKSERIYGVHIRDQPHRRPKVVYSVKLSELRSTEKLLLRGEVALSRCNPKDIAGLSGDASNTPCDSGGMRDDPYSYTPRFSAAFVLAGSPTDATGNRVSPWFDRSCTQGQHHCALALPEVAVTDVPNAAEKFVNLVVTADAGSSNARSWDVMEVEQNKGALAVTRVGANAGGIVLDAQTNNLITSQRMGIDRPAEDGDPTQVRQLLYQVKLTGVQGGDVISADARMRAVLGGGFSCDPMITTEILVTRDPNARNPKGEHDEELTIKNGANCADHSNDGCKYDESGAVRLENGVASTMYVSYLAVALRSCAAPGGDDKWFVESGNLEVGVRR